MGSYSIPMKGGYPSLAMGAAGGNPYAATAGVNPYEWQSGLLGEYASDSYMNGTADFPHHLYPATSYMPDFSGYRGNDSNASKEWYESQHNSRAGVSRPFRYAPPGRGSSGAASSQSKSGAQSVWKCNVCDCEVPLSSKDGHLEGKRHKAKLAKKQQGGPQRCEVCNMDLTPDAAEAHFKGRKHQKKAEVPVNVAKAASTNQSNGEAPVAKQQPGRPQRCEVCNVDLMPNTAESHYKGRKHLKNAERTATVANTAATTRTNGEVANQGFMDAELQGDIVVPLDLQLPPVDSLPNPTYSVEEIERAQEETRTEQERQRVAIVRAESLANKQRLAMVDRKFVLEQRRLELERDAEIEQIKAKYSMMTQVLVDRSAEQKKVYARNRNKALNAFHHKYSSALQSLRDAYRADRELCSTAGPAALRSDAVNEALEALRDAERALVAAVAAPYMFPAITDVAEYVQAKMEKKRGASEMDGSKAGVRDPITTLSDLCRRHQKPIPSYTFSRTPAGTVASVVLDGLTYGMAEDENRRRAQHMAANETLKMLWNTEATIPECRSTFYKLKKARTPRSDAQRADPAPENAGDGTGHSDADALADMLADDSGVANDGNEDGEASTEVNGACEIDLNIESTDVDGMEDTTMGAEDGAPVGGDGVVEGQHCGDEVAVPSNGADA